MNKKLLPVLLALALLFTAGILYAQAEETENVFTEYNEAIDYLREKLVAREKNITFTYTGDAQISLLDALEYEGSAPNEGDYLRWSISRYTQQEYADGRVACTVSYRTSAEKETELANAVSSIVSELTEDVAPEAFSEYRRAVLIFNWLCDNVAYSDGSNTSSAYSAYSALIDRTAKCEGYALAFYRLAREMGLDCRILTGYVSTDALEISHAWNAFRIGESWYYADSTHGAWSGDEDGSDRFAFFMMPAFWDGAEYVASYTDGSSYLKTAAEIADYPFDLPIVGSCPEGGGWTLHPASGQLILTGESAGETDAHWKEYVEIVTSVSAENGVIDLCVECLTAAGLPLHCGDESEIAALAADASIPCHTSSAEPVQPPTCKNTGRSAGTVCGICELYLTGGETLPVTDDHTDNGEGVCSVCGIVIDCVEHGFCGKDLRWYRLPGNELRITGTGEMTRYRTINPPWLRHLHYVMKLEIADGITKIPASAFSRLQIEQVVIPDSVIEIGRYAFGECNRLRDVVLPSKLTHIPEYAFHFCTSLENVQFPENLESIGAFAFARTNLKCVYLPQAVTENWLKELSNSPVLQTYSPFAESAVEVVKFAPGTHAVPALFCAGMKELKEVILPDTVKSIGYQSFARCENLRSIQLPPGITSVAGSAFEDCINLQYLYIPESAVFSSSAINGDTSLKDIYFASGSSILIYALRVYSDQLVFHCKEDCNAVSFAQSKNIPCHTDLDFSPDVYGTLCTGETVTDFVAYCRECGKTFTKTGVIDENGHNVLTDAAVAPTCTADGKTEGSHCGICGKVFTAQETIPALGHFDTLNADETPDGVCDVCGARLWTAEEPEPEPQEEPVSITKWFTALFEGIAKFFSNLIKMFRRMFG